MAAGNGVSGIFADLIFNDTSVQVKEVKKWTFNPKQDTKTYASNVTGGFQKAIKAIKSGTGTIDGVWDPWDPITDHMTEGSEVTFKGQCYTGQFWIIPCLIDSMTFEQNMETGDVVSWTANYTTQGAWTKPVVLAATTTTTTTTAAFMPGGMQRAGDLEDAPASAPAARAGEAAAQAGGGKMSAADLHAIARLVAEMLAERSAALQASPQAA